MTNLDYLGLARTQITDNGLEHLGSLRNLGSLDLTATQVTDIGLEHLQGLTSLQVLLLRDTEVTERRVEQLKAALPDCDVIRVTVGEEVDVEVHMEPF